jgi:DNA-binding PadR family transcriptional regulator
MPSPDAVRAAEIDALLPLAPRDYLILFALVDGSLHRHGLLKRIEADAGGVPFDPANLYRSLRKLDRDGLVIETAMRASERGGPPKRSYRLTPLGKAVLGAEAARLTTLADAARARKLVPSR